MDRREFLITIASGAVMVLSETRGEASDEIKLPIPPQKRGKARISLIKTRYRASGIKRALDLLQINPVQGKDVLLKPNFNSADPFPASTHNDTLSELFLNLKNMGAKSITVGERSGIPDIGDVMAEKGIYSLCKKHGVDLVNFDDLTEAEWIHLFPKNSQWLNGFDVAKPVIDSKCIVTTCCLKTHGSGGVFSMSLKLSVGITRKWNMIELHMSFMNIRKMIAEINLAYEPALILLDGLDAFVDKGPSHGPIKQADVILAGTDRIAIDAVGVAILKELGSNKDIMSKKIFAQDQIAWASKLGLGISRPEDIEIVTDDQAGKNYAEKIMRILFQG
ncbi:MAG: DUF362 domain-containing protein [Nitrospirota bacterium]